MEGRVWLATSDPSALVAIDVDRPDRIAIRAPAEGRITSGAADPDSIWTLQYETGIVERRSSDGGVVGSVCIGEQQFSLVVGERDVWVNPVVFTQPITRIRKDSLEPTKTSWRAEKIGSHVVADLGDTIWLGDSRFFDDATLIRLDRRAGDHAIVVSGPNAGPYVFVGDAIWVAGLPPDAMTIMSTDGHARHVVAAPHVFEMQATRDAVFVLGNRGNGVDDRWLERRSLSGTVERVIGMPSAWSMAADTTAVCVAVAPDRFNGPVDVVTLDPETLAERGRVTVPGRFPALFPASRATARSAY